VSALVNLADWRTNHYQQLAIAQKCLGNNSHFYSDSGLVDLLFVPLAKADEGQRLIRQLSTIQPKLSTISRRFLKNVSTCP
jgi:hypothetical protein